MTLASSLARSLPLLFVPLALHAQALARDSVPPREGHGARGATVMSAVAVRTATAPTLDGKDDDEIWRSAPEITAFQQYSPTSGGAASFRTSVKVSYDDRYLYVLVRMYDPHPDSIRAFLSRRDVSTPSDRVKIMIDSYHDRRTGYELAVNPKGVKSDFYTFNDSEEDPSWDGVWDVATSIDAQGWIAEYRVPFSQMRFPRGTSHVFGFSVVRDIARLNERDSWPLYHRDRTGIASQFGELTGIEGLGTPRHLEIMPYAVTKNITTTTPALIYGRKQDVTGGADLKYGVTSNFTLDATVNPDFGQVEADPAVLNLSAFETFFREKRPFFIEGSGIFRFDLQCHQGACSSLFYSRRIGRSPEITDTSTTALLPTSTSIIGAAKLTGRTQHGLSVGILDAVTDRESGSLGQTLEPRSNYFVGRVQQELGAGKGNVGVMLTGVNRQLDNFAADSLRRTAYTGGIDFRRDFHAQDYRISGYVVKSQVAGSARSIALTQANSTHYFQKPGDRESYDTTRTSLGGDAERLSFDKVNGLVQFQEAFLRYSAGFEINDLGFLTEAGRQSQSTFLGLNFTNPTKLYRDMFLYFDQHNQWNTARISSSNLTDNSATANFDATLTNSWLLHANVGINRFIPVYDDRASRGGPALRRVPYQVASIELDGDPRLRLLPSLGVFAFRGRGAPDALSWGYGVDPSLAFRLSRSVTGVIAPHFDHNSDNNQWVDNLISSDSRDTAYTFGHLDQNTVSLTARVDYTLSPKVSLQIYAQPFVSSGKYTNWRQLSDDPRNADYDRRFFPYGTQIGVSAYNFNVAEFRSNVVLRWEYRAGSTIYAVWTQGRSFENDGLEFGGFNPRGSARDLYAIHPDNTFLIKASYWFSL
ncbi:MAG: carbohydrate binding family 9 domain-containing protein [Gemmatimonadota bacterium]|nr:carbohydrate binding family 9 domain-containing protein [Gemmatimonadota bacterium]